MNTANTNNGKVPKSQAEFQSYNLTSVNSSTDFEQITGVDGVGYKNRLIALYLNEYQKTGRFDYPVLKRIAKDAYTK